MKSIKKLFIPLLAFALIGILALVLSEKPKAPPVAFITLDNQSITMESLKGKVVLVNFWATDCPGCIKEMPDLIKAYQEYHPKGFELIAVAMPYDPPAQVLNYTRQKSLPFPVMHDGHGDMTKAFGGVDLTPTTFIFDKSGNRIKRVIGEIDFPTLQTILEGELR